MMEHRGKQNFIAVVGSIENGISQYDGTPSRA